MRRERRGDLESGQGGQSRPGAAWTQPGGSRTRFQRLRARVAESGL